MSRQKKVVNHWYTTTLRVWSARPHRSNALTEQGHVLIELDPGDVLDTGGQQSGYIGVVHPEEGRT